MMHGWMMTAWLLIAVAVAGAIAVAVVVAVRVVGRGSDARRRALAVLDDRYASGEIDDDEYRQRRRLLER